jgi:photolyase PhrII
MMDLPAHLAERTRVVGAPQAHRTLPRRTFVLYWMRTAVRGHENPALDVALALGRAESLPVFVHHGLTERYPYASDRHHRFACEGARDVARELAGRGIGYAFHLEREGHRGPVLRALADAASVVVTEDFPSAPLAGWTTRLAARRGAPVLAVDTACVVPPRLVGRAFDRAFAYRKATEKLWRERVSRAWPELDPVRGPFVPDLPYAPFPVAKATDEDLACAIATCAIDHGVGPVPHTPGGAAAGYARWGAFRDGGGLARYARDRNDPLKDGVSRMSAYLHYGHVSPLRLARECEEIRQSGPAAARDGAEKYLDELATWREVAYTFAAFTPGHDSHDTLDALPPWARKTLADHASDPREALLSWETLARGRTGDALWDAAQAQLRVHGELHNNVRMTWGKAIAGWTRSPEEALGRLVDLNHRFALDGRDPASYGGLLWCLGLFDRPFSPEAPVTGTLRPRPTADHARRLDVAAFAARTRAPAHPAPPRVVVVGAGAAGLACARTLADHGWPVTVLDKGRVPGGRLSTRVVRDLGTPAPLTFDHGAQVVTAQGEAFARHLASWHADGIVAPLARALADAAGDLAQPEPAFCGTPGMSALGAHLARDLDIRSYVHVARIERRADGSWALHGEGDALLAEGDALVLAVPAPQARALLEGVHPPFAEALASVEMDPCWALLLATADRTHAPAFAGRAPTEAIGWICREDRRRTGDPASSLGAGAAERWVVHASAAWSRAHLEDPPEVARDLLLREAGSWMGPAAADALRAPVYAHAHRWRFARTARPLGEDTLWDPAVALGVAGDFMRGDRVEDAFTSGVAAAGRLLHCEALPHAPRNSDRRPRRSP